MPATWLVHDCSLQVGWTRKGHPPAVLVEGEWALLTCTPDREGPTGGRDRLQLVKLAMLHGEKEKQACPNTICATLVQRCTLQFSKPEFLICDATACKKAYWSTTTSSSSWVSASAVLCRTYVVSIVLFFAVLCCASLRSAVSNFIH